MNQVGFCHGRFVPHKIHCVASTEQLAVHRKRRDIPSLISHLADREKSKPVDNISEKKVNVLSCLQCAEAVGWMTGPAIQGSSEVCITRHWVTLQ